MAGYRKVKNMLESRPVLLLGGEQERRQIQRLLSTRPDTCL